MQRSAVGGADGDHGVGATHDGGFVAAQLLPLDQAVGGGGPAARAAQVGEGVALLEQVLAVMVVEDQRRALAAAAFARPRPARTAPVRSPRSARRRNAPAASSGRSGRASAGLSSRSPMSGVKVVSVARARACSVRAGWVTQAMRRQSVSSGLSGASAFARRQKGQQVHRVALRQPANQVVVADRRALARRVGELRGNDKNVHSPFSGVVAAVGCDAARRGSATLR